MLMSDAVSVKVLRVALVGNPNTGKSTLFQALTGIRQQTANYPGVTVEKKVGQFTYRGQDIELVDLPGTYSLAPRSPDEMVSVELLLGLVRGEPQPDVIICIVDAANLLRNLYLVSQVLELNRPVVLALNMCDLARGRGIQIRVEQLEQALQAPVISLEAHRGIGLAALKQAIVTESKRTPSLHPSVFSEPFEQGAQWLADQLQARGKPYPLFLCRRLILDASGFLESALKLEKLADGSRLLATAREKTEVSPESLTSVESIARYRWIGSLLSTAVEQPTARPATWTDRIDRIITHRVWGSLILVFILFCLFQSIFSWSGPLMDGIEAGISACGSSIASLMPDGPLRSLLVDGVLGGVGGVLVFLPQILMLFLLIGLLEDCGYMARAAFLMDKIMAMIGLSGRSFIPLLSSFACAVPGIMGTRVIENPRDRLLTIILAPLMSCSARLPVYTLFITAFVPAERVFGGWIDLRAAVMCVCYSLGIVAAILVGFVLRKTIFAGQRPTFLMELPSYKIPTFSVVLGGLWDRGWSFIYRAGTLILAVSIVVWAAAYFPRDPKIAEDIRTRALQRKESVSTSSELSRDFQAELESEIRGAYLRQSWLGRAGHFIEPVVRPLGWDWRIGCAVIASFPAREVVIGNLGVIYNLGSVAADEGLALEDKLKSAIDDRTGKPVYNLAVALSLLVFFALCAQCVATLAVIRRETNSWRWPFFTFTYMTSLAYVAALVTYQVADRWLKHG